MAISMEYFSSQGTLSRYDPYPSRDPLRAAKLVLQCHVCNFEVPLDGPLMRVCPKCYSSAWEWIVRRENMQPSNRAGHRFKFKTVSRRPASRGRRPSRRSYAKRHQRIS